jgi:hypothetical protein
MNSFAARSENLWTDLLRLSHLLEPVFVIPNMSSHSALPSEEVFDEEEASGPPIKKVGSRIDLYAEELAEELVEQHCEALTVLVVGASGDLAKKKTYPRYV